MRIVLIGAAFVAIAGCNSEETYPVAAAEAYTTLTSLGYPAGLYPLPVGLSKVGLEFEAVPADSAVRWHFKNDKGGELATVTATVAPDGDAASAISIAYAEGDAPSDEDSNSKIRRLIQAHVQPLIVEAVDAKFENRPFDKDLRYTADSMTASATVGDMMKDVDSSLEAHIAKEKQAKADKANRSSFVNPSNATKPSTDLSKYNN